MKETIKTMLVPAKFSDSEFEFMLIKGGILINGKTVYENTEVNPDDKVEILLFKNLLLYYPIRDKSLGWRDQFNRNWKQLKECDKRAKEGGFLVGRYIKEPFADGYAIYQVIRENKKTVRIRVCTGIGDDWVIPYLGQETSVDMAYVTQNIAQREALAAIFSKNAKQSV